MSKDSVMNADVVGTCCYAFALIGLISRASALVETWFTGLEPNYLVTAGTRVHGSSQFWVINLSSISQPTHKQGGNNQLTELTVKLTPTKDQSGLGGLGLLYITHYRYKLPSASPFAENVPID